MGPVWRVFLVVIYNGPGTQTLGVQDTQTQREALSSACPSLTVSRYLLECGFNCLFILFYSLSYSFGSWQMSEPRERGAAHGVGVGKRGLLKTGEIAHHKLLCTLIPSWGR